MLDIPSFDILVKNFAAKSMLCLQESEEMRQEHFSTLVRAKIYLSLI